MVFVCLFVSSSCFVCVLLVCLFDFVFVLYYEFILRACNLTVYLTVEYNSLRGIIGGDVTMVRLGNKTNS